jgi:hypothetical protein
MFAALLGVTAALPTPLPAGVERMNVTRSADGSQLVIELRRRRKVTCYDADGPYAAACRVIGGRLCCETGGWLPPPYNRVEEVVRERYVVDCASGRFDQQGDGRGWQPLAVDAVVRAVAEAQCAAGRPPTP